MRLSIRVLGLEVLAIDASTDPVLDDAEEVEEAYDFTSTPVGFAPSPGDQRWEPGIDLGY